MVILRETQNRCHTFATEICLTQGVPIESVSKMLGHTNIQTTQIYARVVDRKLSHDMAVLEQKLQSKGKRSIAIVPPLINNNIPVRYTI